MSLAYVSKLMHRRYPDTAMFKKVLQSIWHQVNNGQEIYVVGAIQPDDTVKGGTGWGAEFAKLCNKPLFVFDQEKSGWFRWTGEASRPRRIPSSSTPLHRHRHALPEGQRPGGDPRALRAQLRRLGPAARRRRARRGQSEQAEARRDDHSRADSAHQRPDSQQRPAAAPGATNPSGGEHQQDRQQRERGPAASAQRRKQHEGAREAPRGRRR